MYMDINDLIGTDFRGCLLIQREDETVFQKSFGYADLPNKVPNENDTKFATASAGKVFVAIGILQLIERGLLHLNDKIGNIFDFDLKAIDGTITIEELLSHTSGTGQRQSHGYRTRLRPEVPGDGQQKGLGPPRGLSRRVRSQATSPSPLVAPLFPGDPGRAS